MNTKPIKVGVILIPARFNGSGILTVRRGGYFGLPVVANIPDPSEAVSDDEKQRSERILSELLHIEISRYGIPRTNRTYPPREIASRKTGMWGVHHEDTYTLEEAVFMFFALPGTIMLCPFVNEDHVRVIDPKSPVFTPYEADFTLEAARDFVSRLDLRHIHMTCERQVA